MCNPCKREHSCNEGFDYCEFTFAPGMERTFKEEISVLYVAVTRAKKNFFLTFNTGLNPWNYNRKSCCLVNLKGITALDYKWEDLGF